jgi:hypothetical protein
LILDWTRHHRPHISLMVWQQNRLGRVIQPDLDTSIC